MGGSTEIKGIDDEVGSLASFEEVSSNTLEDNAVTPVTKDHDSDAQSQGDKAEQKVPDIQYVLQYLGFGQKVLETIKSDQAFDVIPEYQKDGGGKAESDAKPVLEIVTKVSTIVEPQPRCSSSCIPAPNYPSCDSYGAYMDYDNGAQYPTELRAGRVGEPQMIIHSEHLINALQAVISYYPYINLIGKKVAIDAPYRVLFHHRSALAEYRDKQPSCHDPEYAETTTKHICLLLNYLETCMGERIREEEDRHRLSTPMATFENFWLLLKPGEVLFAKRHDIWTPFIISSVTKQAAKGNNQTPYEVVCWYLEYIGNRITRTMVRYSVNAWNGEQVISSLDVIPAAFFPDNFEAQGGLPILEWQARLGRMYWDLIQKPTYMEYDGILVEAMLNSGQMHIPYRGPSGYMTGRVVVDAEGFHKYYHRAPEKPRPYEHLPHIIPRHHEPPLPRDHLPHYRSRCGCEVCSKQIVRDDIPLFRNFEGLNPQEDHPPESELFYAVLSNVIPAFILGDRRWGTLNLKHLRPVKTDKEAFEWLVLEEEVKLMVKALIGQFAANENGGVAPWANDFVKNKGEGRIFLLHGSPGVGKTCTAECVAELTHRPLMSLTSGDLSVNSHCIETNLSYFLLLGQRYGALVLLDEADVYLERRASCDISRNGLVSVFLRALEYYRGVLFLTTNRVQSFDPAFTSRIHVALHYKPLTDADKERIWTNNFERLDRDSKGRVHVSVATREYAYMSKDVQSLNWNGREIRNAIQTAVALAESDAIEKGTEKIIVTDKHLRTVVKMSRGFKDYLSSGHGRDDKMVTSFVVED